MDRLSYETQGTNTYLVYSVGEDDVVDTMSLGMLTNNKIPGLAPAIFTQMDTTKFIKYNVSSHISVKQFFTGPVNKKRLIGVFSGIVDAMLSAEDYMIDTNSIIMDLDYIFADVSTCETVLICLPVIDMERPSMDFGTFFKNIMFGTQFDQTENCDHIAKIMNYLNSSPVFSLSDFKALLTAIDSAVTVTTTPPPVVTPAVKPVQPTVQKPVEQPPVQTMETQQLRTEKLTPPTPPTPPVIDNIPQRPPVKPVQVPPVQQPPVAPQVDDNTPRMSWVYLMQHYNKENAAIYKAQKEAKKRGSAAPQPVAPPQGMPPRPAGQGVPPVPPAKTPPKPPVKTPPKPAGMGFAIPGQDNNPTPVPPVQQPPVQQPPVQQPPVQQPPVQQPPVQQPPVQQPPVMPQGRSMNFGETTVLGGGGKMGETTVLSGAPTPNEVRPHLVRKKTGEKINLNKPVFRIGKEKSYVDYFIGDNTAVSRSHANIVSRDGAFYVVDTNSTNHTFVNGEMLQSNVEVMLNHGDSVKLANEEFEFKLH